MTIAQALKHGFDLHANVWAPPNNRVRLEQICRYLLRPPPAQDRIHLRPDGRVLVALKTVWRDGTSHFLFEPLEFLEKLAALIPRPAVNLLLYHGVLAPRARWRSHVVRYRRPNPAAPALEPAARARAGPIPTPASTWSTLMRRVFDLDVLACPRCGGRLPIVPTVHDPTIVRAILDHLEMASGPAPPSAVQSTPARSPATNPG